MAQKTFVSPGVYTSEKDITYVTRQVGVTTLGLVGETTIGPAFQPIFVSNYGEFQAFFGGLNATKVKTTGAPQYELPYIAKSYLSQSNQLFVTRVLGFSGYQAGLGWGVTLSAALDPATNVTGTTTTYTGGTGNSLITYSANPSSTTVTYTSSNPVVQTLINQSLITSNLSFLETATTGTTANISPTYYKIGLTFSGASFNLYVTTAGVSPIGWATGTTSGITIQYSGTGYSDVENKLVALLRSRGSYDSTTQINNFELSASSQTAFNSTYTDALTNPLATFALSGTSNLQGAFNYTASLDRTQTNYLPRVFGRTAQDANTALWVEEYFENMFRTYNNDGKVYGINQTLITYNNSYDNYLEQYQPAQTPYVVSELRGNKVLRLFNFTTISDGNAANEQFKISIVNIKPDTKEFDVQIRSFYDTDSQPVVRESFTRCVMDPTSQNYIGRRIGTLDGIYVSKSLYVLVNIDDSTDNSDAFPAGFTGVPLRNYQLANGTNVLNPTIAYKQTYTEFENKRKIYLGLSNSVGIDPDFFDYKGMPESGSINIWTGLTHGFHLDINASGATIDNVVLPSGTGSTYSPVYIFDTGDATFETESGLVGGPYEKLYSRKFTFAPFGGFDGWDIYRTNRTNQDNYLINKNYGVAGRLAGDFAYRTLTNGDLGINSDYYAYLEAIWSFKNPEAVNINVFATPGIDMLNNTGLVESTIEMIEEDRADSLYVITLPDTANNDIMSTDDVVEQIDGAYDSNYSCTYWPWVQINDSENNVLIFVPPTRDVVRNIALTDNIAFPWFAAAGINRGNVDAIQARKKLTLSERDTLYENRINPIATFTSDGIKIWGNKTLQVKESALNRINVRRLLLQARKLISAVSIRLLFEQNDAVVRNQFLALVNPILDNIRSERGLYDFRVVLSSNPEDIDKNQLTGQIFLKPTRALEFIQLEFVIMNTGASFDNI